MVVFVGAAVSIAIKSGAWRHAAAFQRGAQYIIGHERVFKNQYPFFCLHGQKGFGEPLRPPKKPTFI
jgi:hypothetical protein